MKLWILKPKRPERRGPLPSDKPDPWAAGYNMAYGFVVCAETEMEARELASHNSGDETREFSEMAPARKPWLDTRWSTCEELQVGQYPGIVMRDFNAG